MFLPVLATLAFGAGCDADPSVPPAGRRECRLDLLLALDEAEVALPPAGKRPSLVGDAPIDTDDDRLEATVSVGTELRFRDVPVHPGARLRWAVGRSKLHPAEPDPAVVCSLAFERASGPRVPLAEASVGGAGAPPLHEGEVDLASLRGERGTLVAAVAGANAAQFVAWSRLELISEGRPEEPRDRQIEIESVACDLAALASEEAGRAGAVALTVPGAFEARVKLPERPFLRFFLRVPGAPEAGVWVRVLVDGTVLSDHLRARRGAARESFRAFEDVDLAAFSGKEVTLRLEVARRGEPAKEPLKALLGLPRILSRRTVERAQRAPDAPDVFVIVVDTLRADALGCYGALRPASPRVDAFARTGLVYEKSWSQCSWTLPSTATILTGLHPDEHGVRSHDASWLQDDHETLAERLAARGFTCGAIVANSLVGEASNFDQGFESFRGLNWANARKVTSRALAWLDEHPGDRLFAYLHYIDPHAPYSAPLPPGERFDVADGPYAGRTFADLEQLFGGGTIEESPTAPAPAPDLAKAVAQARALYDGEVRYFDRWFGALIDGLRERGRLENSIVLVTADHGEEFLEHGELFHGHHLYEESVRVPFILRAPGLTPGRVATPIDGQHALPLLLDLLGGTSEPSPDERARAHFPDAIHLATEFAVAGPGERTRREAVVRAPWKLIHTAALDREELFDLGRDPAEHEDRHESEGSVLAALRELLRRLREEHARLAKNLWMPDSPEFVERMRALGYVK